MSDPHNASDAKPLRVIIQQPALPKYRIAVFRELARRGLSVNVIYGDDPTIQNMAPDGFEAQQIPERTVRVGKRVLYWHWPQIHYAKRGRCDVLVMAWMLPYLSLIPALIRARINRVPTVLWGHGYSKREAGWRLAARRWVTNLASSLLFYNRTTADRYIAAGIDRRRVFVALNALDQKAIQAARSHWLQRPNELTAFQREKNIADAEVVLFVSRLDPANRVDLLLQAVHRLMEKRPRLKAVIIGKGEDWDRLHDLARSLHIEDRVIFTGAIYDETQVAAWFLSSKVFCYPANVGLSLLHAFGYGLPVITSDKVESQNPEIEALQHERNGLLYRHEDLDALAATIERIMADDGFRTSLAAAAHNTATTQFTLENMVDGMEAAIRFAAATQTNRGG